MSGLIKVTRTTNFFERTIDDIVNNHFFSSFDSNIKETEKSYEMEVAVPGMTKRDLQLQIVDGVLYLKGEKTISSDLRKKNKNVKEFNGTFLQRSFMLPEDINSECITAKCKNGLLKISIQKKNNGIKSFPILEQISSPKPTNWIKSLKSKKWFKKVSRLFS